MLLREGGEHQQEGHTPGGTCVVCMCMWCTWAECVPIPAGLFRDFVSRAEVDGAAAVGEAVIDVGRGGGISQEVVEDVPLLAAYASTCPLDAIIW